MLRKRRNGGGATITLVIFLAITALCFSCAIAKPAVGLRGLVATESGEAVKGVLIQIKSIDGRSLDQPLVRLTDEKGLFLFGGPLGRRLEIDVIVGHTLLSRQIVDLDKVNFVTVHVSSPRLRSAR